MATERRAPRQQTTRSPARTLTIGCSGGRGACADMGRDYTIKGSSKLRRSFDDTLMDERKLRGLLQRYRSGKLAEDALLRELRHLPFGELDFAKVDHHRALRCGFPEVIFSQGKTTPQIVGIAKEILSHGSDLLATRAS